MTKIKLIFGVITILGIITISSVARLYYNKYKAQKLETERYQNNFNNSKQTIDSLITKNGDFQYSINSLQVNLNDLEIHNAGLYNKLKNSNLEIKHLENIISTQALYIITIKDSLKYNIGESGIDTTLLNGVYKIFDLHYTDKWVDIQQKVYLSTQGTNFEEYWNNISLRNVSFQQKLDNNFDIANELIYRDKKWWQFWRRKKVTGVKSHIITDNPYLKVKAIESYKFIE